MHKRISSIVVILALALAGCGGGAEQSGGQQQTGQQQFGGRPGGGGFPGGGGGGFQGGWGGGGGQQQGRTPSVESVEVLYGTLPLEERLSGSVRARVQTDIYPEISAPIVEIFVRDGDFVSAGDPLVRLRATEVEERLRQAVSGLEVAEARVRQSETNLNRHETNLRRIESMAERGLTSATELDNARADFASAQADLDLIRAQRDQAASQVSERRLELNHTVVRAPITGVVGSVTVDLGQFVSSGSRLLVIGDPSSMRVRVTLTERMLSYIRTGTSVNIMTDAAPDEVIQARIDSISPFLHPITHTTEAEIDVEDGQGLLRPGMFVTVDVLYGESELAALVPNAAIYRHPRDGREGVYVTPLSSILAAHGIEDDDLADGEALLLTSIRDAATHPIAFVPVNVVARGRLLSGVTGVEPGDWVVTMGHRMLTGRDATEAFVQPTPWEHIMNLQQMQSRDLLNIIIERMAGREVGG
jgi:HlyD family secretion protein